MKSRTLYHSGRFLVYFLAIGVAVASMRYWSFETVGGRMVDPCQF